MCTDQYYFTICEVVNHNLGPQIEAVGKEIRVAKWKRKSGAGERNWTERLPVHFEWLAA